MTNQEICLYVYQNINIKGICFRIGIRRDVDDIEQIIYDIILHYPNKQINDVYQNGALLSFVWKCVFNQIDRNPKSEWLMLNEYLPLNEKYDIPQEDFNQEREDKLQFIEEEFKSIGSDEIKRMRYKEQQYYIGKELLKNKIKKGWTLDKMKVKFGVGRNSINNCLQSTKKELKEKYERRNLG